MSEKLYTKKTGQGELVGWSKAPSSCGWYNVDGDNGFILYKGTEVSAKEHYKNMGVPDSDNTTNGKVKIIVPVLTSPQRYLFSFAPDGGKSLTDEQKRDTDSRMLWEMALSEGYTAVPATSELEGHPDGTGKNGGEKYHLRLIQQLVMMWNKCDKIEKEVSERKRDKTGAVVRNKKDEILWVKLTKSVHQPSEKYCKEELMGALTGYYYCTADRYNTAIRKIKKELGYTAVQKLPTIYMKRRYAGKVAEKRKTESKAMYNEQFISQLSLELDKIKL